MARSKIHATRHRLNLALPPKTYRRLMGLRKKTEADSVTEVIRRAPLYYEELVTHWGSAETKTRMDHADWR